jgi:glycosyltransferase involved in cell wall biosynthesis
LVSFRKRKRPSRIDIPTLGGILQENMMGIMICLSNSWGGAEQAAVSDIIELAELGLDIRMMCYADSPLHEHLKSHPEIRVLPIYFRPRNFFDFRMRQELRALRAEGVNLFHLHQPQLLGSVLPWLLRDPEPVILCSQHFTNHYEKKDPFHAILFRRLDAMILMSEALKDHVLLTYPLRERQLRVIRPGLNFDLFNPDEVDAQVQRGLWSADNETFVVGWVGRLLPGMGQETFLKAAAGLMKNLPSDQKIKFVLVEEESLERKESYLEELKGLVSQFHLEEQVVFTEARENVAEMMKAFDVFVMSSRKEAFALVAIEAMAMECPIVIPSDEGAYEIVGNREFGLMTRPNDAFDLQVQLRYFLENEEERKKMAKRAREHVKRIYHRQVRFLKTLEAYERNLRRHGF